MGYACDESARGRLWGGGAIGEGEHTVVEVGFEGLSVVGIESWSWEAELVRLKVVTSAQGVNDGVIESH